MCHLSETDHYFDEVDEQTAADQEARARLYMRAKPGQTRHTANGYYAAKFWREAQLRPSDWIISQNKGNGYVVFKRAITVR